MDRIHSAGNPIPSSRTPAISGTGIISQSPAARLLRPVMPSAASRLTHKDIDGPAWNLNMLQLYLSHQKPTCYKERILVTGFIWLCFIGRKTGWGQTEHLIVQYEALPFRSPMAGGDGGFHDLPARQP